MTATALTMPAEKPQSDPLLRVTLSAQLAVLDGATKHCTRCGLVKPCADFHKHSGKPDGLTQWCKACNNANAKAYRNANLEKVREKDRVRVAATPVEARRAKHKAWRDKNTEVRAERRLKKLGRERRWRRWTAQELDLLMALYRYGKAAEIAKALGRSVEAVTRKAHLVGAPSNGDADTKLCPRCLTFKCRKSTFTGGYCRVCKQTWVRNLEPAYLAQMLKMPLSLAPEELLKAKAEQLTMRRLARQLKEAANESSKDPG